MKLSCPNCLETYSVPPTILDSMHERTTAEFDANAGSPMFDLIRELESEPVMHHPPVNQHQHRRSGFFIRHSSEIIGGVLLLIVAAALLIVFGPPSPNFQQNATGNSTWLILLLAYLLPSIIAELRMHDQRLAIAALNILLGWTLLGWVIAFVWSLTAVRQRA
jgi:hypothetical protein